MRLFNRRGFLKAASATTTGTLLGTRLHALTSDLVPRTIAANDHIQIALIGAGGQGMGDTKTAIQVPGVKLVAVADACRKRISGWNRKVHRPQGLQRQLRLLPQLLRLSALPQARG